MTRTSTATRVCELERGRAIRAGARLLERAGRDVDAEPRVVLGDASERLADIADEEAAELLVVGAHELRERGAEAGVRMIVVGTRGHGPVGRALVGSVSAALAATAPCPVLVVPPTAERGDKLDQIERNGAMGQPTGCRPLIRPR